MHLTCLKLFMCICVCVASSPHVYLRVWLLLLMCVAPPPHVYLCVCGSSSSCVCMCVWLLLLMCISVCVAPPPHVYLCVCGSSSSGDNILGVLKHLVMSEKLADASEYRHGNMVFFDLLGVVVVAYPARVGTIINCMATMATFFYFGKKYMLHRNMGR